MRSAVAFDVLVRWLRRTGLNVTYIRNVTDIDDKILTKSEAAGQAWWAWAALHERKFTDAYDALGNLLPTYEPRATGHMTDMIELVGCVWATHQPTDRGCPSARRHGRGNPQTGCPRLRVVEGRESG
jgi:cysteinyl-tRNA synthetase